MEIVKTMSNVDDENLESVKTEMEHLRKKLKEYERLRPRGKGFGQDMQESFISPKDPFAHQYMLLRNHTREVNSFPDLMNPDIVLSNIGDNRTLLVYQRDFRLITRLFDMSLRCIGAKDLFNSLYYGWLGEMRMTSALSGRERDLQSFIIPEDTGGRGSFSFLGKKKSKPKKRTVQDYLSPDEQSNIYD